MRILITKECAVITKAKQLKDRELMDGAEFQELEPVANK